MFDRHGIWPTLRWRLLMQKMPKKIWSLSGFPQVCIKNIKNWIVAKGIKGPQFCHQIRVIEWFMFGLSPLLNYPNNLSESHWEQRKESAKKYSAKLAKITGWTGYTGKTSLLITPTSSSRQCSCCIFSSVPSSVEAGPSASNSPCLAGLHFTPKILPRHHKIQLSCNSHATLMLSIASLLVATHGKSPQTFSSVRIWIMSWLCELASAKSCCSSWTFWAAAASAVRRDWTCQVNNKQRQTNTNKDKQIFQIQVVYAHIDVYRCV